MTRVCSKCGVEQDLEAEFYRQTHAQVRDSSASRASGGAASATITPIKALRGSGKKPITRPTATKYSSSSVSMPPRTKSTFRPEAESIVSRM